MGSCFGSHSELADCTTYPACQTPGLPIGRRPAAFPAERKEQLPGSSSLQAGSLFHDSLIESGGKSRPRNAWAAVGSLAFQMLFLLALVVIPLFHTDPLPQREIVTTLLVPPPAAASGVTTFRAPPPMFNHKSVETPTPEYKTREAPPIPPPPPISPTGGVVGGVFGGVPGAVLSEVLGSPRTAPVLAKAPAPTPVTRIRVASRVAEANLIHDVAPTYPPEAGRARVEGTVVLDAVIGKDGTVRDVRVKSGVPVLAQAATDAVKQWRYRPYLLNGEPIEVDSQITINFTLSRS